MGAGMGENRGAREKERSFAERGSANNSDEVVRDSDNKPVKTKDGGYVRADKRDRSNEDSGAPEVLNKENETPEEAEASGRKGSSSRSFSDRRKTRLAINRNNASVSTGTKKHRSGLNISK